MAGRAPSGMGTFPKSEKRFHNFSFLGRQDVQKRDFQKNEKSWQGVTCSDFREMPIPGGARPTISRFLNAWFQSLTKRLGLG
jgi:hypothetical protein